MSLQYDGKLIDNAKSLRKNATRQENHLWYDFLRMHPVRFQRQKTIGNYIIDFYCHSARLAIELDGSQHYEEKGLKYDEKRTKFLNSKGIDVLRFSNLDIDKNFEAVCIMINQKIKEVSTIDKL